VSAADAELQAVRREVSGLSTDLDTARRELLRARRERDGAQEVMRCRLSPEHLFERERRAAPPRASRRGRF
jgi:hypothetical protein